MLSSCFYCSKVLCCDGSTTGILDSGFPTVSKSSHLDIANSCWNLNKVPTLFGSLLSLESRETSRILAPRVRIGMCFSTLNWVRFNGGLLCCVKMFPLKKKIICLCKSGLSSRI